MKAPLIFCPHCGTNQLGPTSAPAAGVPAAGIPAHAAASTASVGAAASEIPGMTPREPVWREPSSQWREPPQPQPAHGGNAAAARAGEPLFRSAFYPDDYSPQPEPNYMRRRQWSAWGSSREALYAVGAVAIVAAVVAAFMAMNRDDASIGAPLNNAPASTQSSPQDAVQSQDDSRVATGAVGDPLASKSAPPPMLPAAPAVAAAPAPAPSVAVAPPSVATVTVPAAPAAQPRVTNAAVAPSAELAPTRVPPDDNARSAKSGGYAHADLARNLSIAHAGLDKDNLSLARSAVNRVLSEQPRNGDAQQMQQDLTSRESDRDALLGYARLCARQQNWTCAWQNAGHALTIDSSSQDARSLLAQAMAEQGSVATPPQPDVPAVPAMRQ
ncbi:hypothetical protein [Paraburkholderia acidisoli]|uniref:Uncharacterized protein n=1 Tax=Paraburkholderia acidisoli TaxID=2571748 RepID=A0A7Z2GP84_9BURK|nr:hypothetical protein [Paraburkholderia acidisoli]QGZ65413.1 hypothetical protein FAZ98_27010 [Paraburkholderia acidisoli]